MDNKHDPEKCEIPNCGACHEWFFERSHQIPEGRHPDPFGLRVYLLERFLRERGRKKI